MTNSGYLQHWPVIVLSVMVLAVIISVTRLKPHAPSLPIPKLSQARDIVSVHPPPCDNSSSTHKFRRRNKVITEYDNDVARRLAILVERRATAADPDLISLIVDLFDPPSSHMVKMSRNLFNTPQSREVDKILKQKVNMARGDSTSGHGVIGPQTSALPQCAMKDCLTNSKHRHIPVGAQRRVLWPSRYSRLSCGTHDAPQIP